MSRARNPRLEEVYFNGIRFTRNPGSKSTSKQRYFYANVWNKTAKRYDYLTLHREIWKKSHGDIPDGFDIDHIDGNWSNNDISNLQAVPAKDHHKKHYSQSVAKTCFSKNPKLLRKAHKASRAELESREIHYVCQGCNCGYIGKSSQRKFCDQCKLARNAELARLRRQRNRRSA